MTDALASWDQAFRGEEPPPTITGWVTIPGYYIDENDVHVPGKLELGRDEFGRWTNGDELIRWYTVAPAHASVELSAIGGAWRFTPARAEQLLEIGMMGRWRYLAMQEAGA